MLWQLHVVDLFFNFHKPIRIPASERSSVLSNPESSKRSQKRKISPAAPQKLSFVFHIAQKYKNIAYDGPKAIIFQLHWKCKFRLWWHYSACQKRKITAAVDQRRSFFGCAELKTKKFRLRRARNEKISPTVGQKRYKFACGGPEATTFRLRWTRNAKISPAAADKL